MTDEFKPIKTTLQFQDEIALHRTGWIIQRIGWGILIAILICASLGLFGTGILSYQIISDGKNYIAYERFGRHESQTEIKIYAESVEGKLHFTIPQHFLSDFEIEKVIPEPTSYQTSESSIEYYYAFPHAATVSLFVYPKKLGSIVTTIKVNDSNFPLKHFIYP